MTRTDLERLATRLESLAADMRANAVAAVDQSPVSHHYQGQGEGYADAARRLRQVLGHREPKVIAVVKIQA